MEAAPVVQRQCACGESARTTRRDEEQDVVRRSALGAPAHTAVDAPVVRDALRSPGRPLDGEVREQLEPRFRHDFSRVRIHADPGAAAAAEHLSARAFTVGRDIFLGAGEEARGPLLAHELTHVVQQGGRDVDPAGPLRLGDPSEPWERQADSVAHQVLSGDAAPAIDAAPGCVQRAPDPKKPRVIRIKKPFVLKPTPRERLIRAEDVAGILAEHMGIWYTASRFGINGANLDGDDDGTKWFLLALAGNLVWAATAFVNPAAALAIRVMSVAGAAVGSGTMEKMAKEDRPTGELRGMAVKSLSAAYGRMVDQSASLTSALEDAFYDQGLTDRDDAVQAKQRRQVAWKFLFGAAAYADLSALEDGVKSDVEAIWARFLPCWKSLHTVITPTYITRDIGRYGVVCYYNALVASGVADRSRAVTKTTYEQYDLQDDPDDAILTRVKQRYEFPGGATVTRGGAPDAWFGDLTTTLADGR